MLRRHLQSVIVALLVSSSTALDIPSPLNENPPLGPINITDSTLEPQPGHLPNVTYYPWPPQPYQIPLQQRFGSPELVIIHAREFHGSRSVSISGLESFLLEFRENLEREYPIPSLVPRLAKQSVIDVQSYTKWTIEINESLLGRRMPTATAVVVLDEIARQLGRHGPANVFFSVKERYTTLSIGYLEIQEFGGGVMNGSLVNGDSNFYTS